MLFGLKKIKLKTDMTKNWKVYTILISLILGFPLAGTGIILSLFYLHILCLSVKELVGTSSLMYLVNEAILVLIYLYQGWIPFSLMFVMASAGFYSGYIGSHVALKVDEKLLRAVFLIAVIIIALVALLK